MLSDILDGFRCSGWWSPKEVCDHVGSLAVDDYGLWSTAWRLEELGFTSNPLLYVWEFHAVHLLGKVCKADNFVYQPVVKAFPLNPDASPDPKAEEARTEWDNMFVAYTRLTNQHGT